LTPDLQPLDLRPLRDIHDALGNPWWPLASGWWLLLGLLVGLLALVWHYRGGRRLLLPAIPLLHIGDWRWDAHRELQRLRRATAGQPLKARVAELSELLKRIAMARHGRHSCAGLHGQAWLDWLSEQDPDGFDWRQHGQLLLRAPYAPALLLESGSAAFGSASSSLAGSGSAGSGSAAPADVASATGFSIAPGAGAHAQHRSVARPAHQAVASAEPDIEQQLGHLLTATERWITAPRRFSKPPAASAQGQRIGPAGLRPSNAFGKLIAVAHRVAATEVTATRDAVTRVAARVLRPRKPTATNRR
jgi:hypothetical protein